MRGACSALLLVTGVSLVLLPSVLARYESNWTSLDSRPLPAWFDEAKIGIFIVWGVYSVPAFGSEWFWEFWQGKSPEYVQFMEENYRPGFTYQDFAPMFTAEFYDPDQWARVFNASGARYTVFCTKHHDGFTLWPSEVSWNWNSVDLGAKRDLTGELADSLRKLTPHIHVGLYHSLFEWYNPLYLADKQNSFQSNKFVVRKTMPELIELVEKYKPDVIWSDGEWEAPDWYWNSTSFLAWLFNDSPVRETVVVNDRWGMDTKCKHGSFYNCNDRFNPGVLQKHKWENAMTLDKHSWGYRRNAPVSEYLSIHDLLTTMAETISCGGNLLVNVGPTHDGMIPALMEERLRQMGEWLSINGEAIYSSKPWTVQNDTLTPGVWYTSKGDTVYGLLLQWPDGGAVTLGSVGSTANTAVTVLGDSNQHDLQFKETAQGLQVVLPPMSQVSSQWAWTLKMDGVEAVTTRRH